MAFDITEYLDKLPPIPLPGMKSNELSYHLKILASEALIEKSESNSARAGFYIL